MQLGRVKRLSLVFALISKTNVLYTSLSSQIQCQKQATINKGAQQIQMLIKDNGRNYANLFGDPTKISGDSPVCHDPVLGSEFSRVPLQRRKSNAVPFRSALE